MFERQGDTEDAHTFFGTIHDWVTANGASTDIANSNGHNYYKLPGVDFAQWHTYGVLWVPGRVTWYFDDQAVLSAPTYPIFDQQFYYLMFGAQEGANWSGSHCYGLLPGYRLGQSLAEIALEACRSSITVGLPL